MTALVCWSILIASIVGAVTGLHEAQSMIKRGDTMFANESIECGCRGHVYFNVYHAIAVGMRLGWAVFGAWMIAVALMVSLAQYLLMLALVLVVLNDLYEYAYSRGRFAVWFNPYAESFNLADIVKWHWGSRFAHIGRGVIIVGLTWGLL